MDTDGEAVHTGRWGTGQGDRILIPESNLNNLLNAR